MRSSTTSLHSLVLLPSLLLGVSCGDSAGEQAAADEDGGAGATQFGPDNVAGGSETGDGGGAASGSTGGAASGLTTGGASASGGSGSTSGGNGTGGRTTDLCDGVVCNTPPNSTCSSSSALLSYEPTGTCDESGECQYAEVPLACDDGCASDACTEDPCLGVVCSTPSENFCEDPKNLVSYSSSGSCVGAGVCSYESTSNDCEFGCEAGKCLGDPCIGVSCDLPPANSCSDSMTLKTYSPAGTCSGEGTCSYGESFESCDAGCEAGACRDGCLPGSTTCSNGQVTYCNADGTADVHLASCLAGCNLESTACDSVCEVEDKRCVDGAEQKCQSDGGSGTEWAVTKSCQNSCSAAHQVCELGDVIISSNTDLGGSLVSTGTITIKSGVTVSVPSGDLALYAKNIVVEPGASIIVAPVSRIRYGTPCQWIGYGGLTNPETASNSTSISAGGIGCMGDFFSGGVSTCRGGSGGPGGGTLRLIAEESVTVVGTVTAEGRDGGEPSGNSSCMKYVTKGGGGAGGGILLHAPVVYTTGGTLSVDGGGAGQNGQSGQLRIFSEESGPLPILELQSAHHPLNGHLEDRVYNDGAESLQLSWDVSSLSATAYAYRVASSSDVAPTGDGAVVVSEPPIEIPAATLLNGLDTSLATNRIYLNVAPLYGTAQTHGFHASAGINLFHTESTATSPSHALGVWTDNTTATFNFVTPDSSHITHYRYVITSFGDSVPTLGDPSVTATPSGNDMIGSATIDGLSPGVHMMHVVSLDAYGNPTQAVGRQRFLVGSYPGFATISGYVLNEAGAAIQGVKVRLNRGLMDGELTDQTTDFDGSFSFAVTPGEWSVSTVVGAYSQDTEVVTMGAGETGQVELRVSSVSTN